VAGGRAGRGRPLAPRRLRQARRAPPAARGRDARRDPALGARGRESSVTARRGITAGPVLGMLALGVALAWPAGAGETDWWITDSPSDYARSESRGVVVTPDGALELGPRASSSPAESL